MKNIARIVSLGLLLLITACSCVNLLSCTEADMVGYNISVEADKFNTMRRITVINSRTDTIIYELEGVFSLKNNISDELEVICRTGENEYKKHYIYLTDTILYVVEDLQGADVSSYQYKVTFYPQHLVDGVINFEMEDWK